MTRTFVGAACVGLVAYWLAVGVGIPAWRQWEPGDAADIGALSFVAVWMLARRKP